MDLHAQRSSGRWAGWLRKEKTLVLQVQREKLLGKSMGKERRLKDKSGKGKGLEKNKQKKRTINQVKTLNKMVVEDPNTEGNNLIS